MVLYHYIMEDALDTLIDYRGKTPKKAESGIPTLSAKSVKNGFIEYSECYYISPEEYKRFMVRGFPKVGDILLTTEAPMGMVARLDRDDVGIAQRLITLRGKVGILDNDYLLYYLQSPLGQHKLRERETGSTVTGIKQAEFRKIKMEIPDFELQKKIASCLSSIDFKIEVNKKMNRNLSEQAATFFEEWLSTCDEEVTIGDLAENIIDYNVGNHEQVVLVNSSDVTDGHFDHHDLSENKDLKGHFKKSFKKWDILYSEIRPRNRHYAYCQFDPEGYIASTRLMIIRNKPKMISSSMLYQYLMLRDVFEEFTLKTESRSGTFPQGRYEDMAAIKVPFSNTDKTIIAETLDNLYRMIWKNNLENRRLSEIRDSLLPKLMSGELDVSDLDI